MAATVVGATTYTAVCITYPNTSALLLAETSRFPTRRLPTPAGKCTNNACMHALYVEINTSSKQSLPCLTPTKAP